LPEKARVYLKKIAASKDEVLTLVLQKFEDKVSPLQWELFVH